MADLTRRPWLRQITLLRSEVRDRQQYPFSIPAISSLRALEPRRRVTCFVGENGTGKSTLLEGIAPACGFDLQGGTRNFRIALADSDGVFRNVALMALASYGAAHTAGVPAARVAASVLQTSGDLVQHPSSFVIVAVLAAQPLAIAVMLRSLQSKSPRPDVARQPRLELTVNFRVPNFVLENRHGAPETFLDIVSRSAKTLSSSLERRATTVRRC